MIELEGTFSIAFSVMASVIRLRARSSLFCLDIPSNKAFVIGVPGLPGLTFFFPASFAEPTVSLSISTVRAARDILFSLKKSMFRTSLKVFGFFFLKASMKSLTPGFSFFFKLGNTDSSSSTNIPKAFF